MSNIIDMQNFICEKRFNEGVIPFFWNLNPSFFYYKYDKESFFILNKFVNLYILLKYIPNNVHTTLPTLQDSFNDIKSNPRVSKGEWVVDRIYDVSFDRSEHLINQIDTMQSDEEIVHFLKKEFKR